MEYIYMPEKKKAASKAKHTFKHIPAKDKPKSFKPRKTEKSEVKMEHSMVEVMAIGETTKLVEQPQAEAKDTAVSQTEPQTSEKAPVKTIETSGAVEKSEPVDKQALVPDELNEVKQVQEQVEQKEVDKKVDEELGEQPTVGVNEEGEKREEISENTKEPGDVTVVEEGGGLKWLLILVILFLLGMIGGLGYLFVFQSKPVVTNTTTTPKTTLKTIKVLNPSPTVATVAKNTYTIEVLNGSGVSGAAGAGQNYLNGKGYNVVGVGNADNSNYTDTIIKAKTSVPSSFISQLRQDLSGKYTVANSLTSLNNSSSTDVVVVVGSQ